MTSQADVDRPIIWREPRQMITPSERGVSALADHALAERELSRHIAMIREKIGGPATCRGCVYLMERNAVFKAYTGSPHPGDPTVLYVR